MTDVIWTDAAGQAALIRDRKASAVEILDEYLDRVERLDPQLRSYVALDVERAKADARAADDAVRDRNGPLPPFLGVTISVKDVIDVEGLATTESSKALTDHVAASDAPLVGRMRDAGFVVLGKTNVPEFCTSMTSSELNGICRNPWDLDKTPAGSSGGAAAALAAGLCAVAHGTDGAGSVRVPAAYCGLVGTKPTRGWTEFGPEVGDPFYRHSVDGVLSRSARDSAALLDVYAGWHDVRPTWPGHPAPAIADRWQEDPGPLRIAVCATAPFGIVEDEAVEAAFATGKALAELGHDVVERTPEWATILAVFARDGAAGVSRVLPEKMHLVEPRNRPIVERSGTATVQQHYEWVESTRAATREFMRFWEDVDVLVTPTAGMLPMSVDWAPWDQTPEEHGATFATFSNFAQPFNISGQPAVSVPVAWSAGGLPIGVQLAGRHFDEVTLLRVAAQLERVMSWEGLHPAFAS